MINQNPNHKQETLKVLVKGRVQGVGYRASTVRQAHLQGISGWVRNQEDGTVQALIQGSPDQIDRMLEWMRHGPPAARVDELNTETEHGERRYDRFEQI